MSGRFNKGEWSEFFATAKAIVAGQVKKWASQLYRKIACVVVDKARYYPLGEGTVRIEWPDKPSATIIIPDWSAQLSTAWKEVMAGCGRSFACPALQELATVLQIEKLKSSSNSKDDLTMRFDDSDAELGYSVKSVIASRSGCLNASRATTLIYEIAGAAELTNDALNQLGRDKGLKAMIKRIGFDGIKFKAVRDKEWRNRLGEDQAKLLAELVKKYYTSPGSNFRAYIAELCNEERLGDLGLSNAVQLMIQFLYDSVFNRSPQREVNQASGGLLLVQKDGELVCLPWQEAKASRDYLLEHAQLDTPSRERHDFGFIYSRGEFPSGTFLRNPPRDETLVTKEPTASEKVKRQRRNRVRKYRKAARTAKEFEVTTADLAWLSCQNLSDVTDKTLTLQRRESFGGHWEDLWVCEKIVDPQIRYLNLVVGVRLDTKNPAATTPTRKEAVDGHGK